MISRRRANNSGGMEFRGDGQSAAVGSFRFVSFLGVRAMGYTVQDLQQWGGRPQRDPGAEGFQPGRRVGTHTHADVAERFLHSRGRQLIDVIQVRDPVLASPCADVLDGLCSGR